MKPWNIALWGLAALMCAGCRTDPAVPILERELRRQEDEIYRLRAKLDEFTDCGPACSDYVVRDSRSRSDDRPEQKPSADRSDSGLRGGPAVSMPKSGTKEAPASLFGEPDDSPALKPPAVPPDIQKRAVPRDPKPDESSGPSLGHDVDGLTSRSGFGQSFTPSGDSRRVDSIVLNRMLTGGISEQSGAGDQGVLVVVEPRDRSGRPIDAPAEMSVVVVDPELDGDAGRVARWDFAPDETAAMFRRSEEGQAIHLAMTWPEDPPVHQKLHLFVRYVTADGRKLQCDQPIEVALPGDQTARWNRNDGPAAGVLPKGHRPQAASVATRAAEGNARKPSWSPDRR